MSHHMQIWVYPSHNIGRAACNMRPHYQQGAQIPWLHRQHRHSTCHHPNFHFVSHPELIDRNLESKSFYEDQAGR